MTSQAYTAQLRSWHENLQASPENFLKEKFTMGNKRGISTIIATIIMITLVLVSMGIVWIIIQNILTEETENIESGLERVTLFIVESSVELTSGKTPLELIINRDIGKGDLSKIKIILYDENGESHPTDVDAATLTELGSQKFTINTPIITVTKISIAPITTSSSGKETVKGIVDTYIIP